MLYKAPAESGGRVGEVIKRGGVYRKLGVGIGRKKGQLLGDSGDCACHWSIFRVCTGAENAYGCVWLRRCPRTRASLLTVCSPSPRGRRWGRIPFHTYTLSLSGYARIFFSFCIYDKTSKYVSKWDYQAGLHPRDFGFSNYFSS